MDSLLHYLVLSYLCKYRLKLAKKNYIYYNFYNKLDRRMYLENSRVWYNHMKVLSSLSSDTARHVIIFFLSFRM